MFIRKIPSRLTFRAFSSSSLTPECTAFLNNLGLHETEIVHNPSVGELYEYAM
jgi:hypothetical protein